MSAISKLFGGTGARRTESRETLAKELFAGTNLPLKTDIPRPLPMAVFDTLGLLLSPTGVRNKLLKEINPDHKEDSKLEDVTAGQIVNAIGYYYRVNAISKGRMSRAEFVDAIKQTEFESDRTAKRVERLFGLSQD